MTGTAQEADPVQDLVDPAGVHPEGDLAQKPEILPAGEVGVEDGPLHHRAHPPVQVAAPGTGGLAEEENPAPGGRTNPMTMPMAVVFPAPLGPRKP